MSPTPRSLTSALKASAAAEPSFRALAQTSSNSRCCPCKRRPLETWPPPSMLKAPSAVMGLRPQQQPMCSPSVSSTQRSLPCAQMSSKYSFCSPLPSNIRLQLEMNSSKRSKLVSTVSARACDLTVRSCMARPSELLADENAAASEAKVPNCSFSSCSLSVARAIWSLNSWLLSFVWSARDNSFTLARYRICCALKPSTLVTNSADLSLISWSSSPLAEQ
mmetsp:Transcript_26968/g.80374  ORF Transcript_26968/g.80374 Transcript_26968/m.80374 type:complete len:220 (-) Transcript_26968:675-1334(-)